MSPTYFNSNSPSGKKIADAIERLRERKNAKHWSNKQISENSGGRLSESAVQRFFSGETADPSMQTFVEVSMALDMSLVEAFGEHVPEPMHHTECAAVRTHYEARLSDSKLHYEEQLTQCRLRFKEQISDLKESHQRESAQLKEAHTKEIVRLTKWLVFVAVAFVILVTGVLIFTVVDIASHDIGWVRYEEYLKLIADDTTTASKVIEFFKTIARSVIHAFL